VDWVSFPLALVLAAQTPSQPTRPGPMPTLPLTQLDDRGSAVDLDNRTFTLTFAQPVAVPDLLLLLVRGTSLSVVPDPAVSGSFIGELKNVTVRQAFGLILQPVGLDFTADGNVVRVFRRPPDTRIFDLNYVATERTGEASVGGDASTRVDGAYARILSTTKTDVFADITHGIQGLLSKDAAFNVDRAAGLVQVTDMPDRLDRVALYLDAVHDRVHRQVQIDARLVEVELTNENQTSLDWSGLGPGIGIDKALQALAAQGRVSTLSNPRLVMLNNDGLTIAVTPQVAGDAMLMLNVSQMTDAPVPTQSDTLARVRNGETIVIGGFGLTHETRDQKASGATRRRVERVLLITPRIL